MADKKISELTAAAALAGTEALPVVQSGSTVKALVSAIRTYMLGLGLLSSSASGGVGYSTGAGGAVTQATSKTTGVTLNTVCGKVTMNNASIGAGNHVTFTVTNSQVVATDTIVLSLASGAVDGSKYRYWISAVAAGSFNVTVENYTGGALAEALVINFAVLKSVAA
jgi:hypothetical protein